MALYRYGDYHTEVEVRVCLHRDTGCPAIVVMTDGRAIVGIDFANAEALAIGTALISHATLPHALRDLVNQPDHLNG